MMSRTAIALALAALAGLSACGGRAALKPPSGTARVPVPRGATAQPTPQQLMTPSVQSRPERNAELLTKSQEREDDAFDLPPESN
jgi:ABC-type glycerol-3-phosphate transport system substrate-binding protein